MSDPTGLTKKEDLSKPFDPSTSRPDPGATDAGQRPGPSGPQSVAASGRSRRKTVGVLVCHGMGQQVQFETLDEVARQVTKAALESGTSVPALTVSLHPNDGRFLGRAELTLAEGNGDRVDAHFYEAYWAPLTEGKVTLRQTLGFLRDAGLRGLRFAYRDGVFDRWMFSVRQEFAIPPERVLQLGLALWILVLMGVAFSALALVPAVKLFDLIRGVAVTDLAFFAALSYSVALSVLIAVILALPTALLVRSRRQEPTPVVRKRIGFLAPSLAARSAMIGVVALVIAAGSWLTLLAGEWMYREWLVPVQAAPRSHPVWLLLAVTTFILEFVALRMFTERFLVQFVGDVAAYISPFKVSTFEETRHAIQERARAVAKFIFESTDPVYDEVYFIGHSLGSVIAYDALNDSINRDLNADGWTTGSPVNAHRVISRTKLLLTFGSPLDKTAFIFRTQKTNRKVDLREELAEATQPLIVDYKNRGGHWVNLWAPSDWISGRLSYYDSPNPGDGSNVVINIQNRGALRPWKAHTRYWTDPLMSGVVYTALTGKPAQNLSPAETANIPQTLGVPVP